MIFLFHPDFLIIPLISIGNSWSKTSSSPVCGSLASLPVTKYDTTSALVRIVLLPVFSVLSFSGKNTKTLMKLLWASVELKEQGFL